MPDPSVSIPPGLAVPLARGVCDAHVHFFSRGFFEALASQKSDLPAEKPVEAMVSSLGWELPGSNVELAACWDQELGRFGVGQAVLIASVPGDETSVAEAVKAYPTRFWGYFMLNPLAPDAVERTRRAFGELGLRGVCLFPAMHRFSVQDQRLQPIYQLAADHQAVVFVHVGVLTVGVRAKLGLPSKFDMSFSNPIDLHRVALEFPNVNFVIPHFGAGYFREALMLGDLAPNVYLDTSSTNSWTRYYTPSLSLRDVFAKAIEVFGVRRLLFGSDSSFFPRGWNRPILDQQLGVLNKLNITDKDIGAILRGNLVRLMGDTSINVPRYLAAR
jgi:predicted TIM-barrel fold metal-dependent hydrolase